MKILFSIIAVVFSLNAFAQYDPSKINKTAVQYYNQAIARMDDGNLVHAAGFLQQAIESDKNYVDAYLALAGVYSELKNYKTSIQQFEKAFSIDSVYTLDYKMAYSIQLAATG